MHLAFPKAQFWNLKFTKPKATCNLDAVRCAPPGCGGDRLQVCEQNQQMRASRSARSVAKADGLCQPRFATVPERMMGSVDNSLLGSKGFIDGGIHGARAGRALAGFAIVAVGIPAVSGASVAGCERSGGRTCINGTAFISI
jgi:hypothetical protein